MLPAACVALKTAQSNIKASSVQFFVVVEDGDDKDFQAVAEFCKLHGLEIQGLPYQGADNVGKGVDKGNITSAAYLRLHLDQLLPRTFSRVLYLDADTIVARDVTALLTADLNCNVLGAVAEVFIETRRKTHLKPFLDTATNGYFNSGVLLFDWQRLLQLNVLKIVRDLASQKPPIVFHDQDLLNIVLAKKWNRLDTQYNATSHTTSTGKRPFIAHFAGMEKPWLPNYYIRQLEYRRQYQVLLAKTKWAGFVKSKSLLNWFIVLWEPVMWIRQRAVGNAFNAQNTSDYGGTPFNYRPLSLL